eukprot:7852399-Pyramimonas_sp.AAC.1
MLPVRTMAAIVVGDSPQRLHLPRRCIHQRFPRGVRLMMRRHLRPQLRSWLRSWLRMRRTTRVVVVRQRARDGAVAIEKQVTTTTTATTTTATAATVLAVLVVVVPAVMVAVVVPPLQLRLSARRVRVCLRGGLRGSIVHSMRGQSVDSDAMGHRGGQRGDGGASGLPWAPNERGIRCGGSRR